MTRGFLQCQQLGFLIDAIENESPTHRHELFSDKLHEDDNRRYSEDTKLKGLL